MTKVVDEKRAKQGRKGNRVLTILIVALVLASGAWFAVEMFGQSIDDAPEQTRVDPQTPVQPDAQGEPAGRPL